MRKITKKQTLTLLRKVQKFQIEDCGKHRITTNLVLNDNNKLWFNAYGFKGDEVVNFYCWNFRSYDENNRDFEKFVEMFNED